MHMQKPVLAQGNVEQWLGASLVEQRNSLNNVIADAAIQALAPTLQLWSLKTATPHKSVFLACSALTRDAEIALAVRVDKKIMQQMDDSLGCFSRSSSTPSRAQQG